MVNVATEAPRCSIALTTQNPHSPMVAEPRKTTKDREPRSGVLKEMNAVIAAATASGPRRGWPREEVVTF